jgi:hypothetical protein
MKGVSLLQSGDRTIDGRVNTHLSDSVIWRNKRLCEGDRPSFGFIVARCLQQLNDYQLPVSALREGTEQGEVWRYGDNVTTQPTPESTLNEQLIVAQLEKETNPRLWTPKMHHYAHKSQAFCAVPDHITFKLLNLTFSCW